jgi:hypothetical protein
MEPRYGYITDPHAIREASNLLVSVVGWQFAEECRQAEDEARGFESSMNNGAEYFAEIAELLREGLGVPQE